MRVKIVDLPDGTKPAEDAINAELAKLDGYFINDIKLSPGGEVAVITYTETKRK